MARPKGTHKKIDWKKAESYAWYGSPFTEIAAVCGVAKNTLMAAIKREKKMEPDEWRSSLDDAGKSELRRRRHEIAMAGDTKMLIYLGKVRIKEVETSRMELVGDEDAPVAIYQLPDNGR